MPWQVANLSKREIRPDVAAVLGDNWPVITTTGGSSTTAIASALIGTPVASVQNKYLMIESGVCDGEYRVASAFAPATGTITVRRAFSNTIATSVSGHLHEFSPHLYTLGINEAIRECYRSVYRSILHHTFVRTPGLQRTVPLPRDMERVMRIMEDTHVSERVRDYFDRAATAGDPGSKWTVVSGTWGVTSESLYAPGDVDASLILATPNPKVKNGVIEAPVRGDTTNTASRVLSLIFRYEDASNFLAVRLLNGAVDLRRVYEGTESSLTTASLTTTEGVDYLLRIMYDGSWVRIWIDDREVITYELTGANLRYLGFDESGETTYGNVGVRLDLTGSPSLAATSTRLGHYFLHELVGTIERTDWERSYDGRSIQLNKNNKGWEAIEGRMLWLEGLAQLSQLPLDATPDVLTSDTTDTVELLATDPAYDILVQWAAYSVLRMAAQFTFTTPPEKRQEYMALSQQQRAVAERARARFAMRYQPRTWI